MAQRSWSAPIATLRFARVETAIGPKWVAETDAGVAAVSRSEPFAALRRRFSDAVVEPGEIDGSWIEAALEGGPLPPVDLSGLSPFDAASTRWCAAYRRARPSRTGRSR